MKTKNIDIDEAGEDFLGLTDEKQDPGQDEMDYILGIEPSSKPEERKEEG